jgi:hypothetical protein
VTVAAVANLRRPVELDTPTTLQMFIAALEHSMMMPVLGESIGKYAPTSATHKSNVYIWSSHSSKMPHPGSFAIHWTAMSMVMHAPRTDLLVFLRA